MSRRTLFSSVAAVIATVLLVGACATLDDFQRQVIFRPTKDTGRTPSEYQVAFEDVWLTVGASGGRREKLHAWWIPAAKHVARAPAALYLHGAGYGISANLPRIMKLHDEGFSVLAIDYRGFGRSDGELPSEQTSYEDAQAAWAELARRAPEAKHFIYGHSLGGAIAMDLANTPAAKDAAGLVVESSFTSVREMQQFTSYSWIPLGVVQTQYFDSLAKAPKLCMPTLFMHGSADYRIPIDVAKKLFAAAPEPKRWLLVDGARHVDIPTRYTAQWSAALRELKSLAARPRAACSRA
jgi:alpha-beta hydrolase superfamily lysophospholipase